MALAHQELDNSGVLESTQLQQNQNESETTLLLKSSHEVSAETSAADMEEIDYESLPTDKLLPHLIAGGAAGIMEHCAMYPVDCVKTRMMALVPDPKARYKNLVEAFYKIVTQENPRALFRGMTVVLSGAGPAHALYFSCYEYAKNLLSQGSRSTVLAQGGAGAISSLVHDGFMNPIDVIKQRLQMYNTPYRGVVHCAKVVYRTEGIKAFYRSYTTQLSMNIPFQVVHFTAYEYQQDIFNYSRKYNPLSHMLSGAGAGAVAAAITTPLDVAKTLLNTYEQKRGTTREKRVHGMFNAMIKIYQTSGLRGYFKGVTARVVYQIPSTAVCWSVYEFFKHYFGLKESEHCNNSVNQKPS